MSVTSEWTPRRRRRARPRRPATYRVAVIPGDGIGAEVTAAAQVVLDQVGARFGFGFAWEPVTAGGAGIDAHGEPIRDQDLQRCAASDAVLLGAVGGPKWDELPALKRPEQAIFRLRKTLGLFANLRPVAAWPALVDASPLRPELLEGVDMLIVRELTGGLYFGPKEEEHDDTGRRPSGADTLPYSEAEIRRICVLAFELARGRRHKVTSVDKANAIATSPLLATRRGRGRPRVPGHRARPSPGRLVRDAADHQPLGL